jgi:adenosylcobinamide kinase / adenosylcobinamide-phosphate guanylyltransferase
MSRRVLILGGAKSGKSSYAQALAESWGGRLVYLATGQPGDPEMAERIRRHQQVRGPAWSTLEEPLALAQALAKADNPETVFMVDCLTLWVSNMLTVAELTPPQVETRGKELAAALPGLSASLIFVASEVGLGIVPDNALARAFRDLAGGLNQRLARACDSVTFVAAGLPLTLKSALPGQQT